MKSCRWVHECLSVSLYCFLLAFVFSPDCNWQHGVFGRATTPCWPMGTSWTAYRPFTSKCRRSRNVSSLWLCTSGFSWSSTSPQRLQRPVTSWHMRSRNTRTLFTPGFSSTTFPPPPFSLPSAPSLLTTYTQDGVCALKKKTKKKE